MPQTAVAAARFHDRLTAIGAWLGAAVLGATVLSYCYEVVMRYLFASPTSWVTTVSSYFLLAGVMLMAPQVTRAEDHIAVNFLIESAGARRAARIKVVIRVISAVVCGIAGWIVATQTVVQIAAETVTTDPLQVPKWILSAFITYGLASTSLYFLRTAFRHPPRQR